LILACQEITTEDDFAGLRQAWEELFLHCAYPTPFCAWDWAWLWWQRMAAPDSLAFRLLIVSITNSEGLIVALAPFYYPAAPGSFFKLRPLRLLGTRIRCRREDMTDEPILLLRTGWEDAALRALLAHLAARRGSDWDLTHVQVMRRREDMPLASLWKQRQSGSALLLSHTRSIAGQMAPLPDSWAAFQKSLSRSMRDNLPYYPRLLTRHGHDWTVRAARTPMAAAAAADSLIALHHCRSQSTRGAKHLDHLPEPQHERFLREILTTLAAQGRAWIVLLEVGGIPIAAQAVLEQAPMVTFYYSGFDPHWHAYSPITILNAHVMKEAIRRGVPFANYLPESEPWKTRWGTTDLYVMEELTWLPLRPRPLLGAFRRSAVRRWQRHFGGDCDCGFCFLPLTRAASVRDSHETTLKCPTETEA